MAHATLTKAQGIALLKELTSNDAFRQRFSEKPAAALLELGVPPETIVNLDPACLAPVTDLADAETLGDAANTLAKEGAHACLTMWVPTLKL